MTIFVGYMKTELNEKKIERRHEIELIIAEKVARHKDPFNTLTIEYGSSKVTPYSL